MFTFFKINFTSILLGIFIAIVPSLTLAQLVPDESCPIAHTLEQAAQNPELTYCEGDWEPIWGPLGADINADGSVQGGSECIIGELSEFNPFSLQNATTNEVCSCPCPDAVATPSNYTQFSSSTTDGMAMPLVGSCKSQSMPNGIVKKCVQWCVRAVCGAFRVGKGCKTSGKVVKCIAQTCKGATITYEEMRRIREIEDLLAHATLAERNCGAFFHLPKAQIDALRAELAALRAKCSAPR